MQQPLADFMLLILEASSPNILLYKDKGKGNPSRNKLFLQIFDSILRDLKEWQSAAANYRMVQQHFPLMPHSLKWQFLGQEPSPCVQGHQA